jgi:TetR/AcrR family hemagglutinin/protease transcriptional regulator
MGTRGSGRKGAARGRAKRLDPEVRRRKLLQSAVHAFAKKGPTLASHADVAQQARVSLSTVFLYFPTRRALREAVLADLEVWAMDVARVAHEHNLPPVKALYEHLHRAADLFDLNPDYARIWLGWSMAVEDKLWPRYLAAQRRLLEIISATIRKGQLDGSIRDKLNPEDGAIALFGAAYMIAQTKAAGQELERFAGQFVETMFRAGE